MVVGDGRKSIMARDGVEELSQNMIIKGRRCYAIESGFYSERNVESEG